MPHQLTAEIGNLLVPTVYHESSSAALTDDTRALLDDYIRFVRRDADKHNVYISSIEVRGVQDPSDQSTHVIVRLWTAGLSAAENNEYFHDLCGRLSEWLIELPSSCQNLFHSEFILQCRCE